MNWKAFLCVFLLSALVFAQTAPIATLPGADKIVPLRKGQEAPYDGQLFDPATSMRWAFWLEQYQLRLKVDVDAEKAVCKVETTYRDKVLKAEKERSDKVENDLRDRLLRAEKARLAAEEEIRNPPWYRTRDFGLVLGFVGTTAVLGLSIWALDKVER